MSTDHLLGPPEFYAKFSGREYGKRRAIVKDNKDPRKLGRIRVLCQSVYGADLSPWCWPCMPLGGSIEGGAVWVPPVDALVWIEFEEGKPTKPIYTGGFWTNVEVGRPTDGSPLEASDDFQGNSNPLPSHAQGLPDGSDLDGTPRGQEGVPRSSFRGQYPEVRTLKTPGGHTLEFDDTPGEERVLLLHKNGSMLEIVADGSIHTIAQGIVHTYGEGETRHIAGDQQWRTKGSRTDVVEGDYTIQIGGTYRVQYKRSGQSASAGRREEVDGDYGVDATGGIVLSALNNVEISAAGHMNLGAMGNLNLSAGGVGSLTWSNGLGVPNPMAETVTMVAQNGRFTLMSTDPTGAVAQVGVMMQSLGAPSLSPTPITGSLGPVVKIGNLRLPALPEMAPMVNEPAVLGMTLMTYLDALHAFLTAWLTDYGLHAHPDFSPSFTAPVVVPSLLSTLSGLTATYLAPTSPKAHPLILSDMVFLTK